MTTILLTGVVVWLVIFVVFFACCRAAAIGDAIQIDARPINLDEETE